MCFRFSKKMEVNKMQKTKDDFICGFAPLLYYVKSGDEKNVYLQDLQNGTNAKTSTAIGFS